MLQKQSIVHIHKLIIIVNFYYGTKVKLHAISKFNGIRLLHQLIDRVAPFMFK